MRHKIIVLFSTVVAVVGGPLSGFGGPPSAAGAVIKVDLVGTWTGPYQFPTGTADLVSTTETLIVQRQNGPFLWGHDNYTQNGQTIQIPVRGSLETNNRDFTLAERNGFFRGAVQSNGRMQIRFTRTDDQFTSFAAVLHRSP